MWYDEAAAVKDSQSESQEHTGMTTPLSQEVLTWPLQYDQLSVTGAVMLEELILQERNLKSPDSSPLLFGQVGQSWS